MLPHPLSSAGTRHPLRDFRPVRAAAALLLPLLLAAGCGGRGPGAVVSGKVTVDGKPPAAGTTVTLVGPDNKPASAAVAADGSYAVIDAPLGPDRVAVSGPPPGSGPAVRADMAGMPSASQGQPVPKRYANPNSGLSVDVKPGRQTFDIQLTR